MRDKNRIFSPAICAVFSLAFITALSLTVYLSIWLIEISLALAYTLYGLKVLFCLLLISSQLNERTKTSLVFLSLIMPCLIIPFYLVFRQKRIGKKEKAFIEYLESQKPKSEQFESKMSFKCKHIFAYMRNLAGIPNTQLYKNTSAEYFSEAKDMLSSLTKDLEKARTFIFLEFYIVASGEAFENILSILKRKAKSGVDVRIIYDGIGSLFRIPTGLMRIMKESGIRAVSHRSFSLKFPGSINNRNHRKIAVIDGECAYTGGINLADEYIHSRARLGRWKDSAVRISGEGVNALTYTFLSDFAFLSASRESFSKYYRYRKKKCDGAAIIFSDGPQNIYREKSAKKIIISMLDSAERKFIFTTPYLICDDEVFTSVRNAAMRGVKVIAILPKTPDKYLVSLLSHRYAERISTAGAEVYLYSPGFLHSKSYLCDEKFLMIGTVNLDNRSLCHNFENGVLFSEHNVISEARADLDSILSESEPYEENKEGPLLRLICSALEIFAPLL